MKAISAVLLALVLIVGGAKVLSGHASADMPTRVHDHPQPPPLLEMLPPIGPVGFVLMWVIILEGEEPVQPSAFNTKATKQGTRTPVNPSQSFPPKTVESKKVRK